MPFSLTGDLPAPQSSTGRIASSAALSGVEIDAPPPIDILPPYLLVDSFREELRDAAGTLTGYRDVVSGYGFSSVTEYDAADNFISSQYRDSSGYRSGTTRETLRDESGAVTGFREVSSGESGDYSYQSVTEYDPACNLLAADHSDSSGYRSSTTRTELRDAGGNLTGYLLTSAGGGNGYSYTSREIFDTAYTVLSSEYVSEFGDGGSYRSSYRLETQRDSAGAVTGYVSNYTWTDGVTEYSNTDRYDSNWNYVDGDSVKPDVVIDDGPAVLPVVSENAGNVARIAVASAESAGASALDGSGKRGAKLVGSAGNDTFFFDDTRDHTSGAGKGEDTVMSNAIALDLRRDAFKGIENATLMGRKDLELRGNGSANELSGNAGDNRIDGYNGSDTLFGGLGEDVFVIRGGQRGTADRVTDFSTGEDTLALVGQTFRGLFDRTGELKEGVIGDRLLFDAGTGELSFDRDGAAGRGTAQVIAILVGVDAVHADDFSIG